MKLRIAESVPGELTRRAVDAVRVIERITGRRLLRDDLVKGDLSKPGKPTVDEQITQTSAQFEYPVLKAAAGNGGREVARIRKLMLKKMNAVVS